MQSTSSEPSSDTTIIRTGSDGRLRYSAGQRQELLEAFDRSGLSAMGFSRQHGISYQTFIAWLRKRRHSGEALPPGVPAFAEVMLKGKRGQCANLDKMPVIFLRPKPP